MEQQHNYDYFFTQCCLNGWALPSKEEEKILFERKIELNSNFDWSDENIEKLRKINDLLHKKEAEVHKHANWLRSRHKEWMESKRIEDFEMQVQIKLYSSEYERFHPGMKGKPFFIDKYLAGFGHKEDDPDNAFVNESWNEYAHSSNPIAKDYHCHTFHCIYDHTILSWEDIIKIEYIGIDIKVWNQFFVEIK